MLGTLLRSARQGTKLLGCSLAETNRDSIRCLAVATQNLKFIPAASLTIHRSLLHTSPCCQIGPSEPEKWPKYNKIVYPPRPANQPMRVAEVFHHRSNIKAYYKKFWYLAALIRGMTVDEAIKQLSFVKRALAQQIIEVLKEAQELAVNEHNVEYKSNLWIAESFVGKAYRVKSLRKHRGYRFGTINYNYCHYFVCLREGQPPAQYYTSIHRTGNQLMEDYLREMRNRKIKYSL